MKVKAIRNVHGERATFDFIEGDVAEVVYETLWRYFLVNRNGDMTDYPKAHFVEVIEDDEF